VISSESQYLRPFNPQTHHSPSLQGLTALHLADRPLELLSARGSMDTLTIYNGYCIVDGLGMLGLPG